MIKAADVVKEGVYFVEGDEACAMGAIAAGCRFCSYYPITPVSEIAEAMAIMLPKLCLLYTSPSPRDRTRSRMPSSA